MREPERNPQRLSEQLRRRRITWSVPSAPLVPQSDPTLLFVNAGMVPFKNVFTGAETPPAPRAASSQKCVRAGGKHNDLDNVGYTARHHTFFEMLGNFSFGDYFKAEAIELAWRLITQEFGLDEQKLLITVYSEDEEAAALWRKIAGLPDLKDHPPSPPPTTSGRWATPPQALQPLFRNLLRPRSGHSRRPARLARPGRRPLHRDLEPGVHAVRPAGRGGEREPASPPIDTGMGERPAAVLQGVHDNYDTDLFKALIAACRVDRQASAEGDCTPSHRVIADHLRSSCFLIADGVSPSNEGRGYVLRRIMRRAMRHAYLLGANEPLMSRLAPVLVELMGTAYPELRRAQPVIVETLRQEEERFGRMLGRGMPLLEDATSGLETGAVLSGETAFKLYDTYGFPLDLTQDAIRAKGLTVDTAGFDDAMDRQRKMARANWSGSGQQAQGAEWLALRERLGPTDFTGYDAVEASGEVQALVKDGALVPSPPKAGRHRRGPVRPDSLLWRRRRPGGRPGRGGMGRRQGPGDRDTR